jgi:hypothetical protein
MGFYIKQCRLLYGRVLVPTITVTATVGTPPPPSGVLLGRGSAVFVGRIKVVQVAVGTINGVLVAGGSGVHVSLGNGVALGGINVLVGNGVNDGAGVELGKNAVGKAAVGTGNPPPPLEVGGPPMVLVGLGVVVTSTVGVREGVPPPIAVAVAVGVLRPSACGAVPHSQKPRQ